MGTPQHYSHELPERCMQLIDELWSVVSDIRVAGQEDLGPLTTTFLLAMATPVIVLPIERIKRHLAKAAEGYMDDRPLDPRLAKAAGEALGGKPLKWSPFFVQGQWRFASIAYDGQNLARQLPDELARLLSEPEALQAASDMQASEWESCLRNALAHGGVMYLDEQGHQSHNRCAEMLGFVSAKYKDGDFRAPPERLKVLRISETDFRSFLRKWVDWLRSSGIPKAEEG